MQVAVIGSGTMGNGIAHVFAQHGFAVSLIDINQPALDRGVATITKNLDRQVAKATLSEEDKASTLGRLRTFTSLAEGVAGAELIVEAATENMDLKLQIFRDLDQYAPVPVMKLVEVIRGYATSDEVTARVMDLSRQLGKTPTEVNDYPGFVANRILMPMINEAIISLFEGVAGVEEIDTVMKLGMAHPMGPLQLADFIGLDVCVAILRVLHDGLGNPKYAPCPLLVNMVMAGRLGVKSGEGFYQYTAGSKDLVVATRFRK
jgi:3-hydroxybutyryl-CoA dehydrogenase